MTTATHRGTRHNVRTTDDFRKATVGCLYCPLPLTGIEGVTVCETATGRAICTTCCGCPEPGTAALAALEDSADIALDKIEELQEEMANAEEDLQHVRDQISDINQALRDALAGCAGILRA